MDMDPFLPRRFSVARNAVVAGLLLATIVCAAGAPTLASAAGQKAAQDHNALAALIQSSGVMCRDAGAGKGCTAGNVDAGDYYDVELLPDCGGQGLFAGVAASTGVDALDVVPATGSHPATTATLAQGQLVCAQAIARAGQNPLYYYVVAVPAANVAHCKDSALCRTYGDRPIRHVRVPVGPACQIAGSGRVAASCAQGWVSADALDLFSNGM